jgi:hypothetical protein
LYIIPLTRGREKEKRREEKTKREKRREEDTFSLLISFSQSEHHEMRWRCVSTRRDMYDMCG